jgi:hypothetical protein
VRIFGGGTVVGNGIEIGANASNIKILGGLLDAACADNASYGQIKVANNTTVIRDVMFANTPANAFDINAAAAQTVYEEGTTKTAVGYHANVTASPIPQSF